ncbi:MAG: 50S ribosomal protein L11 methyltransferase [Thermodesulfobacteriota bacterium]
MAALFYRLSPCLVLCSSEEAYAAGPGERVLRLSGGTAFNPTHPTTRLCLDLLKEALALGPARSFLDLGCGTGILGLAAAALGLPRVVAVDLARDAARVTRENARANGLAGRIMAVQGSSECLKGSFDLVAANLHIDVQMAKVAELHRLAASPGRLILSGFRDNQEEPLLEQYRLRGWRLARRLVKEFSHPELPPDLSFTWAAWLLERE